MNTEADRTITVQKILACIDKALDVFGTSVKAVIYWGLEHKYHTKKTEVATNPELFCNHIKDIFGTGSDIV